MVMMLQIINLTKLSCLRGHHLIEFKVHSSNFQLNEIIGDSVVSPDTAKSLRVLSLVNCKTLPCGDPVEDLLTLSMSRIARMFTGMRSLSLVNVDLDDRRYVLLPAK